MVGAVVMESSGEDDAAADGTGGGGGAGGSSSLRTKPPNLPWLSSKSWDQLLAYEATFGGPFAGLPSAIESASGEWKVRRITEVPDLMYTSSIYMTFLNEVRDVSLCSTDIGMWIYEGSNRVRSRPSSSIHCGNDLGEVMYRKYERGPINSGGASSILGNGLLDERYFGSVPLKYYFTPWICDVYQICSSSIHALYIHYQSDQPTCSYMHGGFTSTYFEFARNVQIGFGKRAGRGRVWNGIRPAAHHC